MSEQIPILKSNLKSLIIQKNCTGKEVGKLRVTSSSYYEELSAIKSEMDFLTKNLEETKTLISNARHQIAMIGICSASEMSKVSSHIAHLNAHNEGFNKLYKKERLLSEIREKELREKEEEELETERKKQKKEAIRKEQREREAFALDAESDAIEQACVVLKKRNTAIMLKLRRKLVETENTRRDLLKLKDETIQTQNGIKLI